MKNLNSGHKYKELALKMLFVLTIIICAVMCIGRIISLDNKKIKSDEVRYTEFVGTHIKIDIADKHKLEQMCKTLSYGGKVDYIITDLEDYNEMDKSQYGFNEPSGDSLFIIVDNNKPVDIIVNGRFSTENEKYLESLVNIQGKDLYTNLVEVLSVINIGVHNIDKHYYINISKFIEVFTVLIVIAIILALIGSIKEVGLNESERGKKIGQRIFKYKTRI